MPNTPPRSRMAQAIFPVGRSIITCASLPTSLWSVSTTRWPGRAAQEKTGSSTLWVQHGKVALDAHHAVLALRMGRGDRELLVGTHRACEIHHAMVGIHRDIGAGEGGVAEEARLDPCGHRGVRHGFRRRQWPCDRGIGGRGGFPFFGLGYRGAAPRRPPPPSRGGVAPPA